MHRVYNWCSLLIACVILFSSFFFTSFLCCRELRISNCFELNFSSIPLSTTFLLFSFFARFKTLRNNMISWTSSSKSFRYDYFFYICWSPFTILSLYVPCAHVSLGHKMVLLRSYKLKFSYLTIDIVRYIVAFEIVLVVDWM